MIHGHSREALKIDYLSSSITGIKDDDDKLEPSNRNWVGGNVWDSAFSCGLQIDGSKTRGRKCDHLS